MICACICHPVRAGLVEHLVSGESDGVSSEAATRYSICVTVEPVTNRVASRSSRLVRVDSFLAFRVMLAVRKYPLELMERGARMVLEARQEPVSPAARPPGWPSSWVCAQSVAALRSPRPRSIAAGASSLSSTNGFTRR